MTSNRFFIDQKNLKSSTVILYGEEHHHLSRVARIKPKETVWLFDGAGTSYLARVTEITRDHTRLAILEKLEKEGPKLSITLAQALIKSKNMDIIIQKATELGVTKIIPVITARSVVRVEGKIEGKMERWGKIAQEAAKQSRSSFIPSILTPMHLETLIRERKEEKKFLLSEKKGKYLRDFLIQNSASGLHRTKAPSSVLLLIGPEGGWTAEEEENALSHGYEAVSLGKAILKTETAAISSLSLISHFWNL